MAARLITPDARDLPTCTQQTVAFPPPLSSLGPLVNAEFAEEQRQVYERLQRWPLHRLKQAGLVLLGLVGVKRGAYFGKAIIKLQAAAGGELPFYRLGWVLLAGSPPL